MIVVAPSGGRSPTATPSGTTPCSDAGARWGTFVARDLVRAIDADYRTRPGRGSRAIAGISMGGYGAINLALGHTGTFGDRVELVGLLRLQHAERRRASRLGDLARPLAVARRRRARVRPAAPARRHLLLLRSLRPLLRRERLVQPHALTARHPAPLPGGLGRPRRDRLAGPDGDRADLDRQQFQRAGSVGSPSAAR